MNCCSLSLVFDSSCAVEQIDSVVFVEVSNEEDQTRTKEINAILSLSNVCMCTLLLMMLGLNGVVFNCLAVKVNFADGVVLDIYSSTKPERKDKRDK